LVEKADYSASANNTIVYFETEDCTSEEKRIEAAGGRVIQPKMNIGEFGYVSIFIDTEGNTIGLHSRN
jgi:predicted enzyme related to lactoylglutathione lyase